MLYDAIIIGSGLGGLSCGAYLAKNGWKVLVLEKHSLPGGYATSFKRGGFTFDAALHMINGVGKGQNMYKFLEWCGVGDKIEFLKLKYFMRFISEGLDIRLPSGNLDEVISALEKSFPHESEGIRNLFKQATKIYNDVFKFITSRTPLWFQLPIFPLLYPGLFPVLNITGGLLFNKHLRDERLKAILLGNWGYYGLPPSRLNIIYSVFPNFDFFKGAYYPKGGNQMMSNAFVDVIRQNSGEVVLNSEVSSVVIENGRAIGVEIKRGEKILGRKIISNACAEETFCNLIGKDKLPNRFVKRMNKMEHSTSLFCIYLGLNEGFKARLESEEDYEIFVSNTYDLDEDYRWSMNCEVDKAGFAITLYSNIDDSLAKGNKFVLGITQVQGYDYWKKYENDYTKGNKKEYNKEKERMAVIMIERAERIIPEISKHIEVLEVGTPLTLKRYTGNTNGAPYGWANTVKQGSPMNRMSQKTPIKNLYLSSAWTFPGGGQTPVIVSGYRLGRKLVGK
jgi:all-trans-retinol 13,14-reductase